MTDGLDTLTFEQLRQLAKEAAEWADDEGMAPTDLVRARGAYQDRSFLIGVIRGVKYLKSLKPDDAAIEARDKLAGVDL